uniref:Putative cyclophilin-type peptidyl-prolyl cis-trans isomerase n=1 Tax=Nyssomyia neivai TaxID=330878 RepID=A0A1L8DTT1_9DIPT
MQKSLSEVQHLVLKQRDFLLKILEACTSLKTQVETELINHLPTFEIAEMRESLGKAKIYLNMLEQQTPADAYKLYTTLHLEKQRLQSKHQEMFLQCKLDDLIRNYGVLFDFELIKQALATLHSGETLNSITMNGMGHHNPILLLANYCISQLYSRHILTNKHSQLAAAANGSVYHQAGTSQALTPSPHDPGTPHGKTFSDLTSPKNVQSQPPGAPQPPVGTGSSYGHHSDSLVPVAPATRHSTYEINGMGVPISMMQHLQQQQLSNSQASIPSPQPPICTPHVYPIYFFNIEINGAPCGRILIEVRNDVAPKMAKNFGALATGELGFGYKGCQIFQCWENESIITGDFELNNGRGGRSVFEEGFFMPDDTKILAIRGSVGMRRSQKRHDNMGLVGSQFRIILREMRGFTGIFAFVVEGLDLVEKISQAGDSAGKPQSNVVIVNCGKLQ